MVGSFSEVILGLQIICFLWPLVHNPCAHAEYLLARLRSFFCEVSSANLLVSCQRQTGFTNGISIWSPDGHSGGTGRF